MSLYLEIDPPVANPDNGIPARKHYLKIYIYEKPKVELDGLHHKETIELAETVRSRKQPDVQNQRFGFLSSRMMNGDFVSSYI